MFDEKTFQEIERGALDAARGSKGHYVFAFLGLTLLVGSISKSILAGSKLPHTVFMFMYGCALGGIVIAAPSLSSFAPLSELPPEFILFIFLPILIFEGSFNWEVTVFKDVIAQVILVAFPGLVLAAGITAALCKALFTDWTWSVALLFGSIVSATDPVATVVLLRELGADKYLTGVIDGESLLNDSSAIVMYAVLLPVVETGMVPSASGITLVLCRLVLGAIALGLVIGGLMVFALENTHNEVVVEIIITIGSSMISFYLAEHVLGFSGVITIVVAGLCFAFRRYAVSPVNAHSLNEVWEVLVQIANTMIFTIVGILVVVQGFSHVSLYDVLTLFLVYLILQVARFGMLIVLWPFVGWFRPVSWRGLVLVWFSGIRGAVALALSLAINHNRMIPYHFRHQFLILTAGLVVLTTIINGCFCGPVTRLLGLHKKSASRKQSMAQAVNSIRIAMHQAIAALKVDPVLHNSSWPVVWMRTLYALRDPYYDHTDTEITPRDVHEVAQNTYLRGLRIAVLNLHEHGMLAQGSFYALLTLLNRKISENVLITFEDVQQAIHPLAGISAAKSGRLRQARDFLAHALLWIVPGLKNRQSSQELEVYLAYHDVITSALLRFEREIQQSSKSNLSLYYHTQSELKVVEEKLENMAREHPALDYHFKTRICGYSIFNRGLNAVKEMYENGSLSADEFETVETELQELLRRFVQYSSSHPKVSELELFLNLECFRELPKAQVEVLYETCTKQVFDRNNLFTVPDSHVYIILKGLVSLESNEHAIQGEGALVGLVEEPETSYHALTDVELLVVGRSRLTELAKTAPSFSHLLYTARFAYKSFCVLYPQVQHERRSTLLMLCHQGFLVRILEEGSWTIEPHNIACVLVRGSCVMDVNAMLSRRTTLSELIQVDCSTPKYDAVAALPLGTHEPFIADFTLNSEIFVVPLNFTKLGDDPYRNLIHPTKLNGDIQETDLGAMPSMAFPDAGERYREIDFMQQGLLSSHANVSW